MAKERQLFRVVLSSVFVLLLAAGYVLTNANAATAEKLMNAPKVTKTPSPSASKTISASAVLTAINKAQKTKGCNFD